MIKVQVPNSAEVVGACMSVTLAFAITRIDKFLDSATGCILLYVLQHDSNKLTASVHS